MAMRPAQSTLRLARAGARLSPATFDQAMDQLERADRENLKRGTVPVLSGIILVASDGSSWRLGVDAAGALTTTVVPR